MATRNIALGINVKINGTQQTVKSVDELKQAIEVLEGEIATAEFGSEKFKRLSGDLGRLKSGFRDITKDIEGADTEQSLGAFAASVNGVTGAFLVATSAAQAFGVEGKSAEELARFQARALALVNVALGIRQIVEARVKFAQIQRNVVEKVQLIQTRLLTAAQTAYTAVVGTSTGALKAFRIALASTGVGLAVVAIGALISKLMSAKDETEELSEETKTLAQAETEAAQNAGVETLKIERLSKVVKNGQIPLKDRVESYKQLQKLVPELAGYTLEEAQNLGVLNSAIQEQIELIQLRATVTALESYLVELEKQRIAEEQLAKQQEEATKNFLIFQKAQQEYQQFLKQGGLATFEEYVEQQRQYGRDILEGAENTDEQTRATEDLAEATAELSKKEGEIQRRIEARQKAQKALNQAEKRAENLRKEQIKLLNLAAKALGQYNLEGEVSAKVLDDANELLEKQNALLEERKNVLKEQTTTAEEAANQLNRLIGGVVIPEDDFKGFRDQFVELFEGINKEGTSAAQQYQQLVNLVKEAGGAEEVRKQIGAESLEILQDYFETNVQLLNDLDSYNLRAKEANQALVEANIDVNKLVKEISDIQQTDAENLEKRAVTQEKINDLVYKTLFPREYALELVSMTNDGLDVSVELTDEQLALIDETTKSLLQQAGLYNGIFDVQSKLVDLSAQVADNIEKQGEGLDAESFKNLRQFIIDNAESIDAIEETFKTISENSENLTKEQIDNINTLIQNIKIDNFVDNFSEVADFILGTFTNLSGQLSSIVSGANSLFLEQLQYQEEQTLATIGDSTEEARAEREKVEKEFAQQRFDLEKRARVQELQFSLADAIANGAAAYIQALSVPPPFGFILAQLIGGITAQQIGLIKGQIGFTKSKQFTARRGGLLKGSDHENGGIMAQGGLVLEGGEAIINRNAVSQFGSILSQINQSTGGRPLAMDDSRIVEEIRKQNQRPIKTYVLDQDIQDTRKINSRLEEISRL